MPSSYTTRNRLTLQATGENINLWGQILNSGVFELLDFMADGVVTIAESVTLSTANGSVDQARGRFLNIVSAATVTIPSVEKWYLVRALAACTVTNGSASVNIPAGEVTFIVSDGVSIWKQSTTTFEGQRLKNIGTPTVNTDAATKKYVDDTAFSAAAGNLPGQAGNADKFLRTNGTGAEWALPTINQIEGLSDALDLKEDTADRATGAEFWADVDKPLPVGAVWDAAELVTVAYAPSVALDFATFFNAQITLTGNVVFAAPDNAKPGQSGIVRIIQGSPGGRTATFSSGFKFANGIKTLSTASGAEDYLFYQVVTSSLIVCSLVKAPS